MQHFPIFLDTAGRRIVLAGGGDAACAKLRLLLKTQARVTVITPEPAAKIREWALARKLTLIARRFAPGDALCAALAYAATEDSAEDARIAALARADGALVNLVDNLHDSQFITPAIVDRDPVTVAIGTEGAAPVLARAIKADLEAKLSPALGALARVGKAFRRRAEALPMGRKRRDFWRDYYFGTGPAAYSDAGADGAQDALETLLAQHMKAKTAQGKVAFVGAGPGDPELLTLKARKWIDEADVVIHDQLVSPDILELARREATLIHVGKTGFGPSTQQEHIHALMIEHAVSGAQVVRLKSGDPIIYGRLDEEIEALDAAQIPWTIVPGLTAASVATAVIGQSLTKRGRNTDLRFLTGHDVAGFAEQDWRSLSAPGAIAAIYMAKKGSRYLQGRLMMHGARGDTPVTIVENISRADQQVRATTLAELPETAAQCKGPAVLLYGLSPRRAAWALPALQEIAK